MPELDGSGKAKDFIVPFDAHEKATRGDHVPTVPDAPEAADEKPVKPAKKEKA